MTDAVEAVESTDDDFNAGFDEAVATELTETPVTEVAQESPAEVEPKYAKITEQQYADLMARAAEITEIKATASSQLDKAFGKIGGLERLIKDLQTTTPNGTAVTVSADDFAELAGEFPELAEMQMKGLNRALAKLNVKGTAGLDSSRVDEIVNSRLQSGMVDVERLVESKLLGRDHPDWKEVVGSPDDANNEFRQWLSKQPEAYRADINTSYDSQVIGGALDKFKASRKAAAVSQRQSRIEAAVTPRGVGGSPQATSDDDDFNAGFHSG